MGVLFLCTVFCFVLSPDIIVATFLDILFIFFTLEACMYTCDFIVGSNIYTGRLSISDIFELESVDSMSLISLTPGILISSCSSLVGASYSSLTGF